MVSSDTRLKDIVATTTSGLEAILGIEPISYRWKEETGFDTESIYTGFSAQNVEDYLPEAVSYDRTGFRTLSDRTILATVINAIKELWGRVVGLEEKVEEIDELRARIEQLEKQTGNKPSRNSSQSNDDRNGSGSGNGDANQDASQSDESSGNSATGTTSTTTSENATSTSPTADNSSVGSDIDSSNNSNETDSLDEEVVDVVQAEAEETSQTDQDASADDSNTDNSQSQEEFGGVASVSEEDDPPLVTEDNGQDVAGENNQSVE